MNFHRQDNYDSPPSPWNDLRGLQLASKPARFREVKKQVQEALANEWEQEI